LYEARVHAGELQMCGFFVIGSPLMGFGHTDHVGWACTTGGPDTSDVYEVKLKIGLVPMYEYDGEWRKAELKLINIPVKDADPVRRPAIYTHLGPLVSEPDKQKGTAYVGASPYLNSMRLLEQFYLMNTARNAQELFEALGMHEYNEQNVMFADTAGTIGYLRNGATPIRPDGHNWDGPVPGTSSATAWKGLHPVSELVHIFNPPAGYMQNCNISPANMMIDSPLTPDKYRDYIYNVSWDLNNPRGIRSTSLLHEDSSVTVEEAQKYAMDVYDVLAPHWQENLRKTVEATAKDRLQDADFARMVQAILDWDGRFTPDCTVSSLYKFWRLKCGEQINCDCIATGQPLSSEDQGKLIALLDQTSAEMKDRYGTWDVAWGDIHKVGRGGQLYPVGGADFRSGSRTGNFTETLFDVATREDAENPGQYIARSGSMALILMFFGKGGVESKSCVSWGQSARPESPHYMDQGEHLYGQLKLKPTFWKKDDLLKNLESEKVLAIQ
jgi:acyl-homoserine lactone acylase PvdQ